MEKSIIRKRLEEYKEEVLYSQRYMIDGLYNDLKIVQPNDEYTVIRDWYEKMTKLQIRLMLIEDLIEETKE